MRKYSPSYGSVAIWVIYPLSTDFSLTYEDINMKIPYEIWHLSFKLFTRSSYSTYAAKGPSALDVSLKSPPPSFTHTSCFQKRAPLCIFSKYKTACILTYVRLIFCMKHVLVISFLLNIQKPPPPLRPHPSTVRQRPPPSPPQRCSILLTAAAFCVGGLSLPNILHIMATPAGGAAERQPDNTPVGERHFEIFWPHNVSFLTMFTYYKFWF